VQISAESANFRFCRKFKHLQKFSLLLNRTHDFPWYRFSDHLEHCIKSFLAPASRHRLSVTAPQLGTHQAGERCDHLAGNQTEGNLI
jgi:hypothetical protein